MACNAGSPVASTAAVCPLKAISCKEQMTLEGESKVIRALRGCAGPCAFDPVKYWPGLVLCGDTLRKGECPRA